MGNTFKSILVPLDGSELAEDTLPFAREFARRFGAAVTLFHVCEPAGHEPPFMCQSYVNHTGDLLKGADENVPVESLAVSGKPADEIIRYAKEHDFDFILMASHGRSGLGRWLLGSVTDKVVRASPVPVLVVRAGAAGEAARPEAPGRSLLVPLDGSQHAEAVLPYAAMLAGAGKTRVVLLRVYRRPFVTADYPEPDWEDHIKRIVGQFRKVAEDYLEGVKQRLAGDLDVTTEVIEGDAAEEIVRYAREHDLEMIVMATHGDSPLAEWEFGDAADKVVRNAGTPVFLVRPEVERAPGGA